MALPEPPSPVLSPHATNAISDKGLRAERAQPRVQFVTSCPSLPVPIAGAGPRNIRARRKRPPLPQKWASKFGAATARHAAA